MEIGICGNRRGCPTDDWNAMGIKGQALRSRTAAAYHRDGHLLNVAMLAGLLRLAERPKQPLR